MKLSEITLTQTCGACPEQYDAFYNSNQVGYLRLRHGHFTVEYGFCGGELLYHTTPNGDGCFDTDERKHYLKKAKKAIRKRLRKEVSL